MNKIIVIVLIVVALGAGVFFVLEMIGPPATLPIVTVPPQPDTPSSTTTFVPSSQEIAATTPKQVQGASTQTQLLVPLSPICQNEKTNDFSCYEAHYTSLVKTKGTAAAFTDIKKRYDMSAYVKAQCHPLTHTIGQVAAEQFATVGEAYKDGDSFCWSGYYHGVLETFISQIGLSNLPTQMDKVCANIQGKATYSFDYYNCVHGLGHGVMAATNDHLFNSLTLCDSLTGSWEQSSCASGVFMENVIIDGLNHKTDYLRPSEPLYPCNASPDKYKSTCYLMQTSYMLKINGGDFKKTFEWCRDADGYEAICWQSLGRDASGRSSSDIAASKATCLLGADFTEQSNCVIGAVKDFISYYHSDVKAKEFCRAFEDENLTNICLATATEYYKVF